MQHSHPHPILFFSPECHQFHPEGRPVQEEQDKTVIYE